MDHGVRIFRVDNPHTKPVKLLGPAAGGHPRDRPGRAVPGRGVHPARDDGHAWARSASTSRTRTSRGATPRTSSPTTWPSCRARRPPTCAPTSSPTPRTSCTTYLVHGGQAAFKIRAVLAAHAQPDLGHLLGLRAVREHPGTTRAARSTWTRRSTSTGSRDWDAARGTAWESLLSSRHLNRIRKEQPGAALAA